MRNCLFELPSIDRVLNSANRILIATDFDGTLCPIAASPSEVHVLPATFEMLSRIAAMPQITLAVISGRAMTDIQARVPLDVVYAGNHGLEIAGKGLRFEHPAAVELRPTLASACDDLGGAMRQWPAAWIEDKGLSATVHFRGVEERLHYCLITTARRCLARFGPALAFRVGKKALDVRPRVHWDKGGALEYIRSHLGPFDTVIALGDDRTDETMFRANPGQLNIRIGCAKPTAASSYLSDSAEVAVFLSHVVDLFEARLDAEPAEYARQFAVEPAVGPLSSVLRS